MEATNDDRMSAVSHSSRLGRKALLVAGFAVIATAELGTADADL